MTILTSLAAFIVAIGVLVTVHEYGHYLAARLMGVKVLRFSVGFGKPIYRRLFGRDRTEFVVAAIPLGGYVKMLDEREAPVPERDAGRAFNRKPLAARSFVIVAGPAANFLFAMVAYALMFMIGVPGLKPVVGEVEPGSAAAASGMQFGDEIRMVGRHRVQDWDQANLRLLDHAVRADEVSVVVIDRDGRERVRSIALENRRELLGEGQFLTRLGLRPYRPALEPLIGSVERGSPAAEGGLQPGDRVVSVDGDGVETWETWVAAIQAAPGQPLQLRVIRNGDTIELTVVPAEVETDGERHGRIGAGVDTDQPQLREISTLVRLGPVDGLVAGVARTWEVSILTLRVLGRMIIGEASVKNIAGPVTIAEFAGMTAIIGITAFLGFLALVSVSLGIINLLPIPVLDGGHLMFNLVEWIKGSAVSERTQLIGQQLGLVAIAGLMMLALYNDITRLFG
ncbi:Membrane-associated zinc metalloprotease [Thioalkalivibrio nitratireducens DSM 14787]|uniref:Zinc metalloprotease n=1 Tax=Thioalkalivibrio nitratireducens (strain DSM 14787 / UNIQEM 213 / ALEN2) TaxID=1255043 RepID=L0DZ31_THIND|nr:RIP metalloprotease RseP [Thioalkalivibrio nitratireducens]AGA33626.1 Membrane-associated zinc metalloprotease [Thioalkalivibrio nitratireducens DSM 14787]